MHLALTVSSSPLLNNELLKVISATSAFPITPFDIKIFAILLHNAINDVLSSYFVLTRLYWPASQERQ